MYELREAFTTKKTAAWKEFEIIYLNNDLRPDSEVFNFASGINLIVKMFIGF